MLLVLFYYAAALAQSFIVQVGSSNPHTALCLSIHAKLVARLLTLCDWGQYTLTRKRQ